MRHTSIKLNTPCEFINITKINPLISKCEIKVCYVGEEPNRNKSIITKEVAAELAQSLPGSPIVGYFNEETADFGEHERALEIKDNKLILKDITKPYGFVDVGARCWFQKFLDDNTIEREYLMTEGYLWTGQYPESQRIIDQGNNHSMELDKENTDGFWTKDFNGRPQFFIINESIISKLCILGEEEEPCFEGSTITAPIQFSLEDDFKTQMFSMMNKIQELLSEGGNKTVYNTYAVQVGDALWTNIYEHVNSGETKYSIKAILEDEEKSFIIAESEGKLYRADFSYENDNLNISEYNEFTDLEKLPSEEQFSAEDIEKFLADYKKEEVCPKCGKPISECTCEDEEENKDKYSLEDYLKLQTQHEELQTNFSSLQQKYDELQETVSELMSFKATAERKDKQAMIDSFYMLADVDKEDVQQNIDTYSLDEIEAKLSIICVRNKVQFSLEDEDDNKKDQDPLTYGLTNDQSGDDAVPAWIKAVQETQKTM